MRLLVVLGTRPEAIKLAPVVLAARERPEIHTTVCNTGQHADMCAGVLDLFGISPDVDLGVMIPRQTLTELTGSVLNALRGWLEQKRPDWLIVQGDTTTAFAAALAAFYQKIPVAHVEAGLRTGNIYAPWPEEMNRRLITAVASLHFAPVASNADNLRRGGGECRRVVVTGNTGIDAIQWFLRRLVGDAGLRCRAQTMRQQALRARVCGTPGLVLITAHRRESFDQDRQPFALPSLGSAGRSPSANSSLRFIPIRKCANRASRAGASNCPMCIDRTMNYLPFCLLMSHTELVLQFRDSRGSTKPTVRADCTIRTGDRGATKRHRHAAGSISRHQSDHIVAIRTML